MASSYQSQLEKASIAEQPDQIQVSESYCTAKCLRGYFYAPLWLTKKWAIIKVSNGSSGLAHSEQPTSSLRGFYVGRR
jgi:hypothetical protein